MSSRSGLLQSKPVLEMASDMSQENNSFPFLLTAMRISSSELICLGKFTAYTAKPLSASLAMHWKSPLTGAPFRRSMPQIPPLMSILTLPAGESSPASAARLISNVVQFLCRSAAAITVSDPHCRVSLYRNSLSASFPSRMTSLPPFRTLSSRP